jgi:hypothetical protein
MRHLELSLTGGRITFGGMLQCGEADFFFGMVHRGTFFAGTVGAKLPRYDHKALER